MAEEVPARTVYRNVRTDPPTRLDFTSNEALGIPSRHSEPEMLRLWSGISVWATEAQARRNAARYPNVGRFIAAIRIEADMPIRIERTLRRPGHHTLWGEPADLLTRVAATFRL